MEEAQRSNNADALAPSEWPKVVLRINGGINSGKKISPGLAAAECARALLAAADTHRPINAALFSRWQQTGQRMFVLKAQDTAQMVQVAQNAQLSGLLTHATGADGRYRGLTQLEMQTVLVVGPGPSSVIDGVTGGLPLF